VLKHLILPLLLLLGLLVALGHDFFVKAPPPDDARSSDVIDPNPVVTVQFHDLNTPVEPKPKMKSRDSERFGLTMIVKDDRGNNVEKKLTFDRYGRTNNTCVKVDGREFIFGEPPGIWVKPNGALPEEPGVNYSYKRQGKVSVWKLDDYQLYVTQTVEVVPGEQTRKLDTLVVHYSLENRDRKPHEVGIRFLLDTYIGTNDGVPFTIPGQPGLCDTRQKFAKPSDVPDYIEALENADLRNPGTVARVQFRISKQIESPTRVLLGGWPHEGLRQVFGLADADNQNTMWNVPEVSMRALHDAPKVTIKGTDQKPPRDSAVTMYWDPRTLEPSKRRKVGFAYGLGSVASDTGGGHLLVSIGGRLVSGGDFTLNALVNEPVDRERLKIELPDGFVLLNGEEEQGVPPAQTVDGRRQSSVTWRIRAGKEGPYKITVTSTNGAKVSISGRVNRASGVFD
jgi:hypothetical protein